MVVFDELSGRVPVGPGGRIDASRYPNFARLAREATWYRNATTVADYTSKAVPAILTGRRPQKGQLPTRADHPATSSRCSARRYGSTSRSRDRALPADSAGGAPAGHGRRLRELVSDLSIVSLHRLLPEDLEDDLPAVDQTFSGFGDGGAGGRQTGTARPSSSGRRIFKRFPERIGSARGARRST